MQSSTSVLHPDFKPLPYWWEAYRPNDCGMVAVPNEVTVTVIGGGYAGLSCALELARNGVSVCVLDAAEPGSGASTISGGCVMGGFRVGKTPAESSAIREMHKRFAASAEKGYRLLDEIITRERIGCSWIKGGRFVAAWTPEHFEKQRRAIEALPPEDRVGLRAVTRDEQREAVGTDFYYGGIIAEHSAKLHPALYFKGLLDAVQRQGVSVCAQAAALGLTREKGGWLVKTPRGAIRSEHVFVGTNGYTDKVTPELRRRLVPSASHAIATEDLDPEQVETIVRGDRTVSETQRVLSWFRFDGRRLIFGGRARFTHLEPRTAACLLHGMLVRRFPQLKSARITHVWSGNIAKTFDDVAHTGVMDGLQYALGCNGSGVSMMTYLGWESACRILGKSDGQCGFDRPDFPSFPFYTGDPSLVLPVIGTYYRARDAMDRSRAEREFPQHGSGK